MFALLIPDLPVELAVGLSFVSRGAILGAYAVVYLLTPEVYPTGNFFCSVAFDFIRFCSVASCSLDWSGCLRVVFQMGVCGLAVHRQIAAWLRALHHFGVRRFDAAGQHVCAAVDCRLGRQTAAGRNSGQAERRREAAAVGIERK